MTLTDQIKCVERELAMRGSAYPKWIRAGTMKPEKAAHEIAAMRAVLETLISVQAGLVKA